MIDVREIDEYIKTKQYRLINSFLVWQDGKTIIERYYNGFTKESRNVIRSVVKSILSISTGICLNQGLIKSLDEPIYRYLNDFNQSIHPYHKAITIRHLLTMTSGIYWVGGVHYHCPMLDQLFRVNNCIEQIADTDMADVPGMKYVYKEWDVILLSDLISKATKMSTYDFCARNLYGPLGIKSGEWAKFKNGVDYNISLNSKLETRSDLSARDLAKLGLLFLDNGRNIVSESYVKETVLPSRNAQNYGLLWWLFEDGYGCMGYGGQEIKVIPNKNMVYVIQATATAQAKSYGDVFQIINSQMQ